MKKNNQVIKGTCIGINEDGKGIVRFENQVMYIPYLIDGEKASIEVITKNRYTSGKLLSITEKSKNRAEPKCKYFYDCGGCQLQHMSYESQLEYKENYVRTLMKPFGKTEKIIGMEEPYNYRNKIHSTFSMSKNKEIVSGFYKEYSHEVIPIERCIVQDERADKIIKTLKVLFKSFKILPYEEDSRRGFLRHVLIKTGFQSNQIMVVLVVSDKIFPSKNNFTKALIEKHPEITTIVMNINNRDTSVVLGNDEKVLYGKGIIEDQLLGLTFQIAPKSFYQINPIQTEKLYNKTLEFANLKGTEVVLDAYSGVGTISLIASKNAKEVIGVEINKDAVKNARINAQINRVKNVKFYDEDAGEFMVKMAGEGRHIDVVFMDPPRTGSDEKFISALGKLKPSKIVYISCNPSTQFRDLKQLTRLGYDVKKIQPVDMFCQTGHVETVVLLSHKKSQASSPSL